MATKKYVFHSDAAHGWLAVKRKEIEELGILNKISRCSYQKGQTVYLEEDCDANIFVEAKDKKGEKVETRESYCDRSPIRNYECFYKYTS